WKTIAIFSCRTFLSSLLLLFVILISSIKIAPSVGLFSRLKQRINVDFPLPDKPIITKTSPCLISMEASYTPTVCPVSARIFCLHLVNLSSYVFEVYQLHHS